LKLSRLSAEWTDCGKLFYAFEPAIENALNQYGHEKFTILQGHVDEAHVDHWFTVHWVTFLVMCQL